MKCDQEVYTIEALPSTKLILVTVFYHSNKKLRTGWVGTANHRVHGHIYLNSANQFLLKNYNFKLSKKQQNKTTPPKKPKQNKQW